VSDIVARLRASVRMGAHNGDAMERGVCGKQMIEAAAEIARLRELVAGQDDGERWYSQASMNAMVEERDSFRSTCERLEAENKRLTEDRDLWHRIFNRSIAEGGPSELDVIGEPEKEE
jgi:hypothetical protein